MKPAKPRAPSSIDAESEHMQERVLPPDGDLPEYDNVIEPVAASNTVGDKMKDLAFMEEEVEIIVAPTTDKNAERHVFVSVNGQGAGPKGIPWLTRGVPYRVKRKFVEVLAKAKRVAVSTDEVLDSRGDRTIAVTKTSALAYPFSVIKDTNPRGVDWLRDILAQA